MTSPEDFRVPDALDRVGATASLMCALHCAIMPLVITLLPLIGLQFLAQEWVEWLLVASAAIIGVTSLCFGFKKHQSWQALHLLGVGLTMIVLGRVWERHSNAHWAVPVLVLGGCTVAGSHVLNQYLCRTCQKCASCHIGE